ncbi:hypothetical protein LTR84_007865 [Exophiala bonariae]|uniref:Ubiquitin 3 binding protein But2 C-terminal domain-containing protein n=1 Tax=Exophiala bonariae TaxID=1690606 RepID=A0AAV9NLA0_9EURO|nr:hypothetical protein LTR84_007865 [Exophiala bonariae]
MHFINLLLALVVEALLVAAIPRLEEDVPTTSNASYANHTIYTTVYNSTGTVSVAHTTRTTEPSAETTSGAVSNSTSTISSSQSRPTLPFSAVAIRSGSPIHFLPINAADFRFWLGGQTKSYCPKLVQDLGDCPPGDLTAFGLCGMDVIVPGGQHIFALPNGEIGYTKPHSGFPPLDSIVCPFQYTTDGTPNWEGIGHLSANATRAFGPHGLQACPHNDGRYQVLLDFSNSTGSNVNRTGCLPFVALAVDYTQGVAAWEYI